jgi:ATP-dependent helicase HrpA
MSILSAIPELPLLRFPEELPISAHREAIAVALNDHPVTIICGDTGSGKTTQIPKIALACGRGRRGLIGCTQPRRLATLAMARRVAEELGQEPGRLVGYQHRFDRQVSDETRIKFMTDGILLAETRRDPLLRAYDTLIIDEAHERSLNIDFLLGLVKTLLPRRPDLRVLVSSATLDAGHFAEFFNGAPVLQIPGRLFPIDIRYRPPEEDDADLPRLIADAVDELGAEGEGDMLVFLPGERDIRETGEVLAGRRLPRTEIIPLLASLPAGEQQRAFRLSSNRRIILATNVAETSVTLPGIRFVIDSGLARVSRYSHRTQVQRLQIEAISQASANQRAGRCGRLGPGICVRLYAEDDFRKRDPYTDPEILRASLAGVILSMLDLRLGDIATFPFLDPPAPAMIKEGLNELDELGAVRRADGVSVLTALGHRLARLPVEPRLARILFAAHDEKALRDALIVVAALECDEPRRRPLEKQADADRLHGRFLTPHSDFAALLRLWRWYEDQNPNRSQTVARRLCRDNYLSYPRMRDWRDLRDQLAVLVKRLELDGESAAGGDTGLHRALLAGLLSRIGKRDPETGEYRGARGLRFALFPGSGLAKAKARKGTDPDAKTAKTGDHTSGSVSERPAKQASREWIVAGELVETSRLYARQAAVIDPSWIEPLAGDLCKRSYHSPEWDADKGYVRVRERVTLYGLMLVDGRMRDYSRINPSEARELFIRHGLVAGEFPNPPPFLRANLERVQTIRLIEEKTRRHGQLVDEEALVAFYERRLPEAICSADALRRWLRQAPASGVAELELQAADLPALDDAGVGFPDAITVDGHRLDLGYCHNPGEPDDGITCAVPVALLPLLRAWRSEWLVPGALPEKIHWMLTSLPSKLRRLLIPVEETVTCCLGRMSPGREPLAQALARAIYEVRGLRVPAESWREDDFPDHLRIAFRVMAADGRELGCGRNYEALLRLFGATADGGTPATGLSNRWQQDGLVAWECGTLPEQVDLGRAGWPIIHYPALVDTGTTVALRLFAEEAVARAEHLAGVCRLLLLGLGREGRALVNPPSLPREGLQLLKSSEMDPAGLGADIGRATVRRACLDGHPDVRTAEAFGRRLAAGRPLLGSMHVEMQRLVVSLLHEVAALEKTAAGGKVPSAAADDVRDTLAWLVFPGFVWAVPWAWLQHYPRYLEGVRVRLERLAINPAADARRQGEIEPYWQRYAAFVTAAHKPPHDRHALQGYRWLVEEFRVSLFAQELRTALPVSGKRLDAAWHKVTGAPGASAAERVR